MNYIIKKPTGDTMTLTLDNLAARFENQAVRAEWSVKPEGGTEWSTVGALLGAQSALPPEAKQTTPPVSDSLGPSACRRYQDAYLVARTTVTIGAAVKVVGIVLGLLIVLAAVILGNILGNQLEKTLQSFVCGVLLGAVVGIPIYVLGVLVSAHGQVLKATLDTAVHGSPFLKQEDMARVMSL